MRVKCSHTLDVLLHSGPIATAAATLCFVYLHFTVIHAQLSEKAGSEMTHSVATSTIGSPETFGSGPTSKFIGD